MPSITQSPELEFPDVEPGVGDFSTEHILTPYGSYTITVRDANDQGKLMMPLGKTSASPPTCVIASIHAPVAKKYVEWSCTRPGTQPVVPSANVADSNLVLLHADYWPMAPQLLSDGATRVYGFAGLYIYACLGPYVESDGFAMSFAPYQLTPDPDDTENRVYQGANFDPSIVG